MKKYFLLALVFLSLPFFVSAACIDFNRELKVGMEGEDVHELQQVLNSNKLTEVAKTGTGSLGKEDMYFGKATEKAVIAFQKLYAQKIYPNVEKPKFSGTLDEATRVWLHDASCEVNVVNLSDGLGSGKCPAFPVSTSSVRVKLSEPYVATVRRGDLFTLFGVSFTDDNTIDIGNTSLCKQGSLEDGSRLDFRIPLETPLGYQYVRVVNKYGKSNLIRLLILEQSKTDRLGEECVSIKRKLTQGSKGNDVEQLQRFLNRDSRTTVSFDGVGSSGKESTIFGPAVVNAVKAFQMIYRADVLTPAKLTKPTGSIGTLSANKIRSLSQCRPGEGEVLGPPYLNTLSGKTFHLGELIHLYGKNFTTKTTINLCGRQIPVMTTDGNSLSFIVPMDVTLGSCRISVSTEFGTSGSQRVTIASGGGTSSGPGPLVNTKPPVLSMLLPGRGKIGDEVVAKGKYFTQNTSVVIAGVNAKVNVKTNDELIFTVPGGISVGAKTVFAETALGKSTTKNFEIISQDGGGSGTGGGATTTNPGKKVTLYSVSPYTIVPGNVMSLRGDGFTKEDNEIQIDGQPLSLGALKSETGKDMSFTLPVETKAGSHTIAVQNQNGLTNTKSFYVDRSSLDAPVLTSVTPNPVGMGGVLTLSGKNFTDENSISVDNVLLADVKSEQGGTKASVTLTEQISLGKHRISLSNSKGRTASLEFEVTYGTGPYLIKVLPTTAKTLDVVKLTGVHLDGTVITIGEKEAAAAITQDGKSADVTVPLGLSTGMHSIVATGSHGKSNELRVLVQGIGAPSISRISPQEVEVGRSTTIYGRQFNESNTVFFNGTPVFSGVSSSGMSIPITIPSTMAPGDYKVTVQNKFGTSNEGSLKVLAVKGPEITNVVPNPAYPGSPIAIQGSGFVNPNNIKIGTYETQNGLISTMLQATIPSTFTAGTYPVSVTNVRGVSNTFMLTIANTGGGGGGTGTTTGNGTRQKPVITDIEFPSKTDCLAMLARYTLTVGFVEPEFDYVIRGMNFSKKWAKVVIGIGDGGIGFDGDLRSTDGSSFVATIGHGSTNKIGTVKDHLTWIKDVYFGRVCIKALVQQTAEEGGMSDQFEVCKRI